MHLFLLIFHGIVIGRTSAQVAVASVNNPQKIEQKPARQHSFDGPTDDITQFAHELSPEEVAALGLPPIPANGTNTNETNGTTNSTLVNPAPSQAPPSPESFSVDGSGEDSGDTMAAESAGAAALVDSSSNSAVTPPEDASGSDALADESGSHIYQATPSNLIMPPPSAAPPSGDTMAAEGSGAAALVDDSSKNHQATQSEITPPEEASGSDVFAAESRSQINQATPSSDSMAAEGSGAAAMSDESGSPIYQATPSNLIKPAPSQAPPSDDTIAADGSGAVASGDDPANNYQATPSNVVVIPPSQAPDFPDTEEDTSNAPEEITPGEFSEDDLVTGVPEMSTEAHWQSIKKTTKVPDNSSQVMVSELETDEPVIIDNSVTGVPEGSTEEPYMPKPPGNKTEDNVHVSGKPNIEEHVSGSPIPNIEPQTLVTEGYSREYSDGGSKWTMTTAKRDLSITQKIDTSSEGYSSLMRMIQDLNNRRNDTIPEVKVKEYFDMRLADEIAQTPQLVPQLANITKSKEYIRSLMATASQPVRDAYAQIISVTSEPDFYYIPKKQRYHTVNQIITNLGPEHSSELMNLNTDAKKYCRECNVDTPPYTLGNIVGNRLANGAILTK